MNTVHERWSHKRTDYSVCAVNETLTDQLTLVNVVEPEAMRI